MGCMLYMLDGRQLRRKEDEDTVAGFNWEEIKMDRHSEILNTSRADWNFSTALDSRPRREA
jgi:hypothetical protein